MASTLSLSSDEARMAAAKLDAIVEERITLALTPEVLAKLAAKGYTEATAREFLRQRAAQALIREYAA